VQFPSFCALGPAWKIKEASLRPRVLAAPDWRLRSRAPKQLSVSDPSTGPARYLFFKSPPKLPHLTPPAHSLKHSITLLKHTQLSLLHPLYQNDWTYVLPHVSSTRFTSSHQQLTDASLLQAAKVARASERVVLSVTARFCATTFRVSPSPLSAVSLVVVVSSVSPL